MSRRCCSQDCARSTAGGLAFRSSVRRPYAASSHFNCSWPSEARRMVQEYLPVGCGRRVGSTFALALARAADWPYRRGPLGAAAAVRQPAAKRAAVLCVSLLLVVAPRVNNGDE